MLALVRLCAINLPTSAEDGSCINRILCKRSKDFSNFHSPIWTIEKNDKTVTNGIAIVVASVLNKVCVSERSCMLCTDVTQNKKTVA
jgi:hypothetical protein